MRLDRNTLYRFPWSPTDNPSGWVEVTDCCNLSCPGCYKLRIEGHRPLEEVVEDIKACRAITNCDSMKISGGEPLIYPHIVEVVEFIARNGMKPLILTNGLNLDRPLAVELMKAGLSRFNFHIDSGQNRPGWKESNESELNELRRYYADLVWELDSVQCGFNATISRTNLDYIPDIVKWATDNIKKVRHLAFIAMRGIPPDENLLFFADSKRIDADKLPFTIENLADFSITTEEMLDTIQQRLPGIRPCAYISGTALPETHKYLVSVIIGGSVQLHGVIGAKAVEIVQVLSHLISGRHTAFSKSSKVGKKIFLLALFDKEIKRSLGHYLRQSLKNPARLFSRIYTLPIALEQPIELIDGEVNLCDGCINMMIYNGRLIPSCRVEEYRLYNTPITVQRKGEPETAGFPRGKP